MHDHDPLYDSATLPRQRTEANLTLLSVSSSPAPLYSLSTIHHGEWQGSVQAQKVFIDFLSV